MRRPWERLGEAPGTQVAEMLERRSIGLLEA
jgi:hypothetical protein